MKNKVLKIVLYVIFICLPFGYNIMIDKIINSEHIFKNWNIISMR